MAFAVSQQVFSVQNWTKGKDRSSDGGIIENNWANCRFEKLDLSALRGWNMSMWSEKRWTEKKTDLNDNEQNTHLYFAHTPEDLLIWIIGPYMSQCHVCARRRAALISASWASAATHQPEGKHPGTALHSPSSTERVHHCAAARMLGSLHGVKHVKLALSLCRCDWDSKSVGNLMVCPKSDVLAQNKITFPIM